MLRNADRCLETAGRDSIADERPTVSKIEVVTNRLGIVRRRHPRFDVLSKESGKKEEERSRREGRSKEEWHPKKKGKKRCGERVAGGERWAPPVTCGTLAASDR